MERESNYDLMARQVRGTFLACDQQRMIAKFRLRHDGQYLYLPFCGRDYRIDRKTAVVEGSGDGFRSVLPAGYNEVMSIYDALSRTDGEVCLTGRFSPVNSLPGTGYTSRVGGDFFAPAAREFTHHCADLARACRALGGVPEGRGDVAFRLEVFPFLPVLLQFYDEDDEFPAQIQLLWDENTLNVVFFETTFFIASHLFSRLSREMEENHAETK